MKIIIDIDEDYYEIINHDVKVGHNDYKPFKIIANGTPLEEIPNPCIECSQNCCVSDLNGEKCSCQKIYVLKEKGWGEE